MIAVLGTSQAMQLVQPTKQQAKAMTSQDISSAVKYVSHGREEDSKVDEAEKVLDSYANSFDRFDNDNYDSKVQHAGDIGDTDNMQTESDMFVKKFGLKLSQAEPPVPTKRESAAEPDQQEIDAKAVEMKNIRAKEDKK